MMFLPFLWMKEDHSFMKWLFWLTCFINVQNLVCMVTFNSVTHYLVLLLTAMSIMVYVWNFRKSFLSLPNPNGNKFKGRG